MTRRRVLEVGWVGTLAGAVAALAVTPWALVVLVALGLLAAVLQVRP